jgi:hypothetical protein
VTDPRGRPARIDLDPDALGRGLSRIVLVVLELLRELLERQAVRRMEAGELTDDEVEGLGRALRSLRDTFEQLRADLADPPDPAADELLTLLAALERADRAPDEPTRNAGTDNRRI